MIDSSKWLANIAVRPHGPEYNKLWDSWLEPRVDGQFTGTTDEIIQWAACKWGIADNILRGQAVRESQWFHYVTYPTERCDVNYGCTDLFSSASSSSKTFCDGLASSGGHDYQQDFGSGICPKTFSIISVMAWQDPAWGYVWPGAQNGTFPFSRDSTAFALDYEAAYLRGCYEGWSYLGTKSAGDIWGCVGSWFSGGWHDSGANTYIDNVQNEIDKLTWLTTSFAVTTPPCSPSYGCPGP